MNPVLIYIRLHQQVIGSFFLGNYFPKTMKYDSLFVNSWALAISSLYLC